MFGRTCMRGNCWGTLYSLYTRIGRPPKWTHAGTLCKKCGHFEPDRHFIDGQQLEAFTEAK